MTVVAAAVPRLPQRLRALREMLPPGGVADVGAGHGALAAWLARDGRSVVATEATPAALGELRDNLGRWGVRDLVDTRLGAGLDPIAPGEVDGAVVAGMGGHRLVAIAEGAREHGLRWLAMQCVQRVAAVEAWLSRAVAADGWRVLQAQRVEERGRAYPTWILEPPA